jgi:hypothetical protein
MLKSIAKEYIKHKVFLDYILLLKMLWKNSLKASKKCWFESKINISLIFVWQFKMYCYTKPGVSLEARIYRRIWSEGFRLNSYYNNSTWVTNCVKKWPDFFKNIALGIELLSKELKNPYFLLYFVFIWILRVARAASTLFAGGVYLRPLH